MSNPLRQLFMILLLVFLLVSVVGSASADTGESPSFDFEPWFEVLAPVFSLAFTAILGYLINILHHTRREILAKLGPAGYEFVMTLLRDFIRAADQLASQHGWSSAQRRIWVVNRVYEALQNTPFNFITRSQIEDLLEAAFNQYKEGLRYTEHHLGSGPEPTA